MFREFHYKDFQSPKSLLHEKKATNSSISLVIPTLNEAATIGSIVSIAKKDLMEKYPLLDEIVVIDSSSSDETCTIAKNAGAKVFDIQDIVPELSIPLGKGSALWKSQFVTTSDIVICIDADINNFESHFIYGLIAPFFQFPEIVFAKSFYKRPMVLNSIVFDNYGGRVTEILVRPLLFAFFPELASMRQPLSGEYGFRRVPMQTIPFSSGYGVEIGMLFDLYQQFGEKAIVQVDMETRSHRNRPVDELGKMSLGIIQTIFRKLEQQNIFSAPIQCQDSIISHSIPGIDISGIKETELLPYAKIISQKKVTHL